MLTQFIRLLLSSLIDKSKFHVLHWLYICGFAIIQHQIVALQGVFLKAPEICAQAWGNISNLCILLFFLAVLGQTGPPYSASQLSLTWRIQYGFGTLIIAGMLYQRCFYLKESAVWEVRCCDCCLF